MITRRALIASSILAALPARGQEIVDLALVLLIDESASIKPPERRLIWHGTAEALRANAGKILERRVWLSVMGFGDQPAIHLPWVSLMSADVIEVVSQEIDVRAGDESRGSTGVGRALIAGAALFDTLPVTPLRSVIDIAGDGASNTGPRPQDALPALTERDITVNGLPILIDPDGGVERYYRDSVISGLGAFVMPAYGAEAVPDAMRAKLWSEVS